ncbi:hypothetical protein GCM10028857_18020 [Salinarchaeum chitinilyticum]
METTSTDRSVGLGIFFVLLAIVGAGAMLGAEASTNLAAAGFAGAVAAGCLAVVAIHAHAE